MFLFKIKTKVSCDFTKLLQIMPNLSPKQDCSIIIVYPFNTSKTMISFARNIQFTRLLKIKERLKEFNFRKPNSKQESLFTVDTAEEYGSRIIFHMQNQNGSWKILPQELPPWILEKEDMFNDIILEELKKIDAE